MFFNLDKCIWQMNLSGEDASSIVENSEATVKLEFGLHIGEDTFEWTK